QARLGLGPLTESLTPSTGKPQLLLGYSTEAWGPVVLKVYGAPRPWEAQTQLLWAGLGVPTPRIIDHGDDPESWLLMTRLDGEPIPRDRAVAAPPEVAGAMAKAHSYAGWLPPACRRLATTVRRHLEICVGTLVRHGYAPPSHWRDLADR